MIPTMLLTKSLLFMLTYAGTLLKIFFIGVVFMLISCKKNNPSDNTPPNNPPPPTVNNKPPGQFTITVVSDSWDTATISWTRAIDPDNDSVSYNIYLNGTLKAQNIKELSYVFRNLKELTLYDVKVIAVDSKQNETFSIIDFMTKKYWLKFLAKVEYGPISDYSSQKTGQMIKANDGGYIIVGDSELAEWPNGPFKMFTLKIDSLGKKIWIKHYEYSVGNSFEIKIVNNDNNGYIICGGDNLIKINNNGDLIWRQSANRKFEIINGIALNNGSIYSVGYALSDSVNNLVEATLGKYDQNGNLIWKKTFSSSVRDEFYDIKVYSNNEIIVLGRTNEPADFCVLKLSMEGNITWNKTYHAPGYAFPENITKTREGNYVFTGFFLGPFVIPYFYLQMIDANGNNIWAYYDNFNHTKGYCVTETNDNALIVTGGYQLTYSAQSALYKFDKNGNRLWEKFYEEFATYFFNKTVIPTHDNGFIINSQKSKAYNSPGETDQIYIFKTDDKGDFK